MLVDYLAASTNVQALSVGMYLVQDLCWQQECFQKKKKMYKAQSYQAIFGLGVVTQARGIPEQGLT
jgi:hypothetical protein